MTTDVQVVAVPTPQERAAAGAVSADRRWVDAAAEAGLRDMRHGHQGRGRPATG